MVENTLDKRTNKTPPTFFLMVLVDIILEKKYFRLREDCCLQIRGVAMGTPFTPSLANLFMTDLEECYILNESSNPLRTFILKRWCFIDDMMLIFTDMDRLHDFNALHPTIKFTTSYSRTSIIFLDTEVFVDPRRKLAIKNHTKWSNRNSLLHYNSFHTKSLQNNVPYKQFICLKRNFSKQEDDIREVDRLTQELRDKEYPESVMQTNRLRVDKKNLDRNY